MWDSKRRREHTESKIVCIPWYTKANITSAILLLKLPFSRKALIPFHLVGPQMKMEKVYDIMYSTKYHNLKGCLYLYSWKNDSLGSISLRTSLSFRLKFSGTSECCPAKLCNLFLKVKHKQYAQTK